MGDLFYPIFPRVLGDRSEFFLLDGGFSTQVSRHVPKDSFEGCPHWTSELIQSNPEAVKQSHKDFLLSGSVDLISTNTYQASNEDIEKAVELCDESILEARNLPRGAGIVGSLGPYSAFLPSGSEYNPPESLPSDAELRDWYRERVRHLMIGGVDVIAFETLSSIKEALVALSVVDNVVNGKCWVSFTCRDSKTLASGEPFKDAVKALMTHPAFVKRKLLYVGINCTSPKHISSLLKIAEGVNQKKNFPEMYGYWRIAYAVYPNWGSYSPQSKDYVPDKKDILDGGDEAFRSRIAEWMKLGARVIGGCCGVNAQLIGTCRSTLRDNIFDVMKTEEDSGYFVDHETIENRLLKPIEAKTKSERQAKTTDFTDSLWRNCELPYKNPGWINE